VILRHAQDGLTHRFLTQGSLASFDASRLVCFGLP
jgi:hypothetical protein